MGITKKEKKISLSKILQVIKENIRFELDKRLFIRVLAIDVMAFMLIFVILYHGLFLNEEVPYGVVIFIFALLSAPLAGFLIGVRIRFNRLDAICSVILFFLLPVATMQMVECFNGKFVYNFSVQTFCFNYLVYLFFYLAVYFLSGRLHMPGLVVNISLYVFGMLNYFIDTFRGTPFLPMDFLTFGTGLEVADGYSYQISWQLLMASIVFFLCYLANKLISNHKPITKKGKAMSRFFPAAFLGLMFLFVFCTDVPANNGYKPDFWNQSRGYHKTGTWLNFCLNLKYLHVGKPSGYEVENLNGIVDSMIAKYETDGNPETSVNLLTGKDDYTPTGQTPNIICIMNESLADLATLGNLETNEDPMPFLHSLTQNTIKGTLEVPVFGAGTSNSEFEFLSGDSIAFLPAGSNVYQSYVKDALPTLVSQLENLGYSSTAYHPYYKEGWNRINVYDHMGFDEYVAIEDFVDQDILDTYKKNNDAFEYEMLLKQRYPDRDMLLRRFVSDSYDYKMIEDMYEKRDKDKPFFMFNVTMQNHGGYAMDYGNFKKEIYIKQPYGVFPMATRYLSLVKYSDEAFKEIVDYYKKQKEPTIILMFGDHQPSIETAFYTGLYGTEPDSLDKERQHERYTTPFVIWANYDIPEAQLDKVSANYLSTILTQTAGLPMTTYQKYLAGLYQTLPVLDSIGYMDKDGNCYDYGEKNDHKQTVDDYQCLEYNHLIDYKHRVAELFK